MTGGFAGLHSGTAGPLLEREQTLSAESNIGLEEDASDPGSTS